MNIQEYTQLIKEIKDKKGMAWDDSIASLAIYKLIENSVLKDFYSKLSINKLENKTYGIVQLNANNRVSHIGLFKDSPTVDDYIFRGDDNLFKMHQPASFSGNSKQMMTTEKKCEAIKIHDAFTKSTNFKDLLDNIDVDNIDKVYGTVNYKTRDFLMFAAEYKKSMQLREAKIKYYGNDQLQIKEVIQSGLLNDLTNFIPLFGNIYKSSNSNINMLKSAVFSILTAENSYSKFEDIRHLMFYESIDELGIDTDDKTFEQHAELQYKNFINSPDIKDSTLIGIAFNHKDNFIHKTIDNLLFDDLKRNVLFETKMIIKEQTLQEIYKANPIIEEIYQQAIKLDPKLVSSLDEQFKHTIMKDLDGVNNTDLLTLLDNAKFYNTFEKKQILFNGFSSVTIPSTYSIITKDRDVIRFVGTDSYSPRYIMCGTKSSVNWSKSAKHDNKCILLDLAMFSNGLDKEYVKQGLDNLYFYCKENKLILEWSIKDIDSTFTGYEDVFTEIKEKYKGLVISCDYKDERKFRAISLIDLPVKDILKLEPVIEGLIKDPAVYSYTQIKDKVMEYCQKTNFKPSNP